MNDSLTRLQKLACTLCTTLFLMLSFTQQAEATTEEEWSPVTEVYAGSVTFIKEFNGKTYFGSAAGELFEADSITGEQTPISPSGIYGINDLIQDSGIFFIATNYGLYTSHDGLKTWDPVKELSGYAVSSVITHGHDLFAATNEGLFKSQDNGASWKKLNIKGSKDFAAQFIISNGTDLVMAAIATEASYSPYYYSHDNGESWEYAHYNAPKNSFKPITVVNGKFYAVLITVEPKTILASSTDGETWSQAGDVKELDDLTAYGFMVYNAQTDKLYLSGNIDLGQLSDKSEQSKLNNKYLKQQDRFSTFAILEGHLDGRDWNVLYDPKVKVSTMHTSDDQLIFGLVNSGNVLSIDLNERIKTPKNITNINSVYTHKMITLKSGKAIVSVSGAEDLHDEDAYWETCGNPNQSFIRYPDGTWKLNVSHSDISPLEDIVEDGTQIFAITCDGLVVRSVNEGETLEQVISLPRSNGPGDTITFFKDKIYASTSEGVSEISHYSSPSPDHKIVYNMTEGEIFTQQLAGVKNMFSVSNKKGVLISDGTNYQPYQNGLNNTTDVQTMDYLNNTLFGAGNGVYRRPDGASSWADLTYNLKSVIGNNAINSITADGNGLYITVDKFGVVKLTFADNRWKSLNSGLDNNNVKSLIVVGRKIYVGGKNSALMERGHL
ncbi:hypothetical protein [Parendozoicomonas sp. Alg238-R29]|uniref:WD40/YVTN/BNR-like repeat-containing protein n=1 Tax=Parendozoicomonas sp. Alg238-R29 TaxID=2993446 RepID=UPI00248E0783|nr:hypothetical protein [Parendozoicomonas sp. Alg238-R29]